MAIYVSNSGGGDDFKPAPEGASQAVCVDVVDLGELPDSFNPGQTKHKINIAWQIGATREDGKRHVVYKRYTASLHEKATLRHDLEAWRGRPFTREEEMQFDLEKLIGCNALINVQHNTKGDRTYANVVSLMPVLAGMPKMQPLDFVRAKDKQAETPDAQPAGGGPVDDVPFARMAGY